MKTRQIRSRSASDLSCTILPMSRDFFDPTPEQQNVLLIDAATVEKAQRMIIGCESCSDAA